MGVKPLEVKSKWDERLEEMPCKSSNCCPTCIVLLQMIVPARDTKIQLAMIYVSIDQQVKLAVPNFQQ